MRSKVRADSPAPIRSQLRELLILEIEEGRFRPGERLPSERELARRYGISRASLRESVAGMVHEGILFHTVGRGTFVADRTPRESLKPAARQVAFMINESIFQFVQTGYARILTGAEEVCRERGYQLVFHSIGESAPGGQAAPNDPASPGGCLLAGGLRHPLLERIRSLGVPVVLLDLLVSEEQPALSLVSIDYAAGMRLAVEHLYQLGHRQIGFIGFPGSEKYRSYWQTLEALGLPYDPHFVEFLPLLDLQPGILAGYRATRHLIANLKLPNALVATNDLVALGVLEALGVAGLRVPQQISLIGFDDLEQKTSPALTTVRADLRQVGKVAAELLLRKMEEGSLEIEQIVVPVELVIRASTAAPS